MVTPRYERHRDRGPVTRTVEMEIEMEMGMRMEMGMEMGGGDGVADKWDGR